MGSTWDEPVRIWKVSQTLDSDLITLDAGFPCTHCTNRHLHCSIGCPLVKLTIAFLDSLLCGQFEEFCRIPILLSYFFQPCSCTLHVLILISLPLPCSQIFLPFLNLECLLIYYSITELRK